MRPATFTLVTAPALLGGIYLSFRMGVYASRAESFPLLVVLGVVLIAAAAGAGLGLVESRVPARRLSRPAIGVELFAVCASLVLPAFFDAFEMPLTFVLFALVGFRLLRGTEADRNAAALAVAVDFALEALLVYRGNYAYHHALVAPLPLWLPAVWANLGVAAHRLYPLLPALRLPGAKHEADPKPSA